MFDRLVRRAVFAESDGIVGIDEYHAQSHETGHAHGIARIVGKGQERAGVGNQPTVANDAVQHRRHAEFTHAEMHVIAAGRIRGQRHRILAQGAVRGGEIRRPAQ
jgi:hypothetical protein